ncbi:DUF2804 domain-containing protein [Clostridium sp. Cult3]|uniref:DUF2804 domain-containing protein n=1 Tax=Clostridium sp. Cult3 TaxID=2079004 RepID=UPI001F3B4657|nr:hypothetical protein [Clostridium sp. Cult3]
MDVREKTYYRKIHEPIDSVVDDDGMFTFGTYRKAIPNINMLEAKGPFNFPATRSFKKFRLKEWEAFQAGNERIFIFGAIYNAKVAGIALLHIYDRQIKKLYRYEKITSSFNLPTIASGLVDTCTEYEAKKFKMSIHNNLERNEIKVAADIDPMEDLPNVKLVIKCHHTPEPIVICQPFGENRGLYSHKNFMPMEGYMVLGKETLLFDIDNSYMIIDDHKGYYPYNMKYDWTTGWGKDTNGHIFGFNLTDNQIINKEVYNENCLWMDSSMYPLPPIKFYTYKQGEEEKWHIKDDYGMVDLYFYPEIKTEIKVNLLILSIDYEAPMGRIEGQFKSIDTKVDISNCFGMGEKKRFRI